LSNESTYLIENDKICSETLHIAGNSFCTKYEFGISLLKELGSSGVLTNKASIKELPDRAKRGADQSLDCFLHEEKYSINNKKYHNE